MEQPNIRLTVNELEKHNKRDAVFNIRTRICTKIQQTKFPHCLHNYDDNLNPQNKKTKDKDI